MNTKDILKAVKIGALVTMVASTGVLAVHHAKMRTGKKTNQVVINEEGIIMLTEDQWKLVNEEA